MWQAIHLGERRIYNECLGQTAYKSSFEGDIYTEFYSDVVRGLAGYVNEDWIFLNADRILRDRASEFPELKDHEVTIHLHDDAHSALASLLHEEVFRMIKESDNK